MTSAAEAPEPISEVYALLLATEARHIVYELHPNPRRYPNGRKGHLKALVALVMRMHPGFATELNDLIERSMTNDAAYAAFRTKAMSGDIPAGGTEE